MRLNGGGGIFCKDSEYHCNRAHCEFVERKLFLTERQIPTFHVTSRRMPSFFGARDLSAVGLSSRPVRLAVVLCTVRVQFAPRRGACSVLNDFECLVSHAARRAKDVVAVCYKSGYNVSVWSERVVTDIIFCHFSPIGGRVKLWATHICATLICNGSISLGVSVSITAPKTWILGFRVIRQSP